MTARLPDAPCAQCGQLHIVTVAKGRLAGTRYACCSAHRKRHAPDEPLRPCHGTPVPGGPGTCYFHNGKPATGVLAPAFKTGKYTPFLPKRLAERYQAALEDRSLLSLRDQIAVWDAHLTELFGQIDTGESGALWRTTRTAVAELRQALYAPAGQTDAERALRTAEVRRSFLAVEQLVRAGLDQAKLWKEIQEASQHHANLLGRERQFMLDAQQMISAEQAMLMLQQLQEAVKAHVHDPATLGAISTTLARAFAGGAGGGVRPLLRA